MKIQDIIKMSDGDQLPIPVEVEITSVGDLKTGESARGPYRFLPLTVADDEGQVRITWFDPAETNWQRLKGQRALIDRDAKKSTYNEKTQMTCNGDGFKVQGINWGETTAGTTSTPVPPKSDTLDEVTLTEFQKRHWKHLCSLAAEAFGDGRPLKVEVAQPMFAALNTATMALTRNRKLELGAAPIATEEGDPFDDVPF